MENDLSTEELAELSKFMNIDAPKSEEKHNIHSFLNHVAFADNTTKLGYLKDEELGIPKLPIRTHQELAVFCEEVAGLKIFGDYFRKLSEVTTSTSLSRDAKLLNTATITHRKLEDVTKRPREKRGFFKKREETEGGGE